MNLINANISYVLQFERVCSIGSRYSGRPIQAVGPAPPLLPPSVELDMSIFPRQFEETIGNCTEMIPVPMMPHENLSHFSAGTGLVIMEEEKSLAMELAMSAMDELVKMCETGEPLWIRRNNSGREVLNVEEYNKMFPWPINGLKQNITSDQLRTEATRDTAVVIMNSITLVDAFLNAVSHLTLQQIIFHFLVQIYRN